MVVEVLCSTVVSVATCDDDFFFNVVVGLVVRLCGGSNRGDDCVSGKGMVWVCCVAGLFCYCLSKKCVVVVRVWCVTGGAWTNSDTSIDFFLGWVVFLRSFAFVGDRFCCVLCVCGKNSQDHSMSTEFLSVRRTMDNGWQVCQGYWMVLACEKLRAFKQFFCTGQELQFFWDSAVLRQPFDLFSEATTSTIRQIEHTKGSNQKSRVPPVLFRGKI